MIKLIVSDIDGTLMDSEKRLQIADIQTLKRAHDTGVEICLASGRMYSEITTVMGRLGINCYAVCQNGAAVVDKAGKAIKQYVYEPDIAISIVDYLQNLGLVTVVCSSEGNHVKESNSKTMLVGKRFLSPLIVLKRFIP